jgi:predicted DNA-binding transcriptional regulator AlpA
MQFIRPRQVLEMIGVSRTTLWRMVREGSFPPPVRITARDNGARGYLREAAETWMRERTGDSPVETVPNPEARPAQARRPPHFRAPDARLARALRVTVPWLGHRPWERQLVEAPTSLRWPTS